MPRNSRLSDYDSLTRTGSSRGSEAATAELDSASPAIRPLGFATGLKDEIEVEVKRISPKTILEGESKKSQTKASIVQRTDLSQTAVKAGHRSGSPFLRPGHTLTYAGLFLFTVVLYARPADFYPSALTSSLALIVALATLAIYIPSQLSVEGTWSARPTEVSLLLLFCLTGLLSIPLAINPATAWVEFSGTFIRCIVIFIVMVNAVRTERRLKGLLLLSILVSCWLSLGALNDYRLGKLTVEGYRVAGVGAGMFGNSNDMALHLVTIMPIAIALTFVSRGLIRKSLFALAAVLMMGAIVVTYSRGAFLGGLVAFGFLIWKLARSNRVTIFAISVLVLMLFLALAPGNYAVRILSIFIPSLDAVGSSEARQGELFRSLYVALRHPLLGIGMGNYAPEMSFRGLVTHNAYTEVAAEMGAAAIAITLEMKFACVNITPLGSPVVPDV